MTSTPPIVLTFAATDPTGGAGLQADILTQTSLGCHALTVVTAITVQDTRGVEDFMVIDPEWIEDQARAILEDMPVAAFKIGMMGSPETVAVIAAIIADYPEIPLVLDPVLASGRGDDLATEETLDALCDLLLPQTTIITPNSVEARRLVEDDEDVSPPDLDTCALRLLDMGCEFVLITGSHEHTPQVINTLYDEGRNAMSLPWDRLPHSYHGSGCTLASAIAALLAHGVDMATAVKDAQEYTYEALRNSFRPGMGQHIPDRLFWAREAANARRNT
ncbi:MAG: bifunctional hydroxymethylpyrimidine kinase/phosphomethylpyrimidine kinase [Betaproteobacteria bacterium]|nr:MAG: bifunctional hydroxymethylpyrimidine kinase/phosphomethylpyrimidine kinase [Betaproteobacteria bacterium]